MMPFCCCTVFFGLCTPLPTERKPQPFGSVREIDSLSLDETVHPAGTGTVTAVFVAVAPVHGDAVGMGAAPSAVPTTDVPLYQPIAVPPPATPPISAATPRLMRA